MRILKNILFGIISFIAIYFLPISATVITNLVQSVPITAGAKGVVPALIKLGIALLLWLILYMLFGRKTKSNL